MPICLGYFSVSAAYGMTAVLSGLPLSAAVVISLTNLTSAGQFAGTNLILAGGTYAELIISMLIINSRYFLMSLSMSQKVEEKMSWIRPFVGSLSGGTDCRPIDRMDRGDSCRRSADKTSAGQRIQCAGNRPLRDVYCSGCACGKKESCGAVYSSFCGNFKYDLLLYAVSILFVGRMERYPDYHNRKRGGSAAIPHC